MNKALNQFYPPAPKGFRPAIAVQWAELTERPLFARDVKHTGSRADGIRYEKKVQEMLGTQFPGKFLCAPWIKFFADGKENYCQPDGIGFHEQRIIVVEIKLSHTGNAWWQLKHLYLPVVRKMLGEEKPFKLLEICKFFDSHTKFPEYFEFTDDFACPHPNEMQVHVWKGR